MTTANRNYPKFLFYMTADQTVGNTKVNSKDDHDALETSESGKYFESPDEAKSGKASPTQDDPSEPLEYRGAGRPMNYVSSPYPKTLFKHDGGGRCSTIIVKNPIDHEAAGAEYFESPGEAISGKSDGSNDLVGNIETTKVEKVEDDGIKTVGQMTAGDVRELHATKVSDVADSIDTVTDKALLANMLEAEKQNPKGERSSIAVAINRRIKELDAQ